jgi:predicted small lipoprotein YifL
MSNANFGSTPPAPQKSGSKTWLWILIAVLVVLPLVLCAGCCGCGGLAFMNAMKNAPPYVEALQTVQANQQVVDKLGQPIEGGLPMGNFNIQNNTGEADFTFTATGPKGAATVSVKAEMVAGTWRTTSLNVKFTDGSSIDLVGGDEPMLPEDIQLTPDDGNNAVTPPGSSDE